MRTFPLDALYVYAIVSCTALSQDRLFVTSIRPKESLIRESLDICNPFFKKLRVIHQEGGLSSCDVVFLFQTQYESEFAH
jgi:hypothetical protein